MLDGGRPGRHAGDRRLRRRPSGSLDDLGATQIAVADDTADGQRLEGR